MNSLREIQEYLQTHLLNNDQQIVNSVTKPKAGEIAERLFIYSYAYRMRLVEALLTDYAVLSKVMGAAEFEKLGLAYVDAYPSHSFSVDVFGKHLPKFLKETEPYNQQPHLAELGRFLWALGKTISSADARVLTRDDLVAIPQEKWGEMKISLHPSVAILNLEWNATAFWQAVNLNSELPQPALLANAENCLVWRRGIQSYYNTYTQEETWVLRSLQTGQTFGAICEGLLQWLPEDQVAAYAVNVLLRCLQDGILSGIEV